MYGMRKSAIVFEGNRRNGAVSGGGGQELRVGEPAAEGEAMPY